MRNLKKIFAVIMVVALMASMMVPALAAGTVNDDKAVKLNNIGLMSGMGLADSSNRIQGLIFAIKAAGKQAEVEALTDAEVAEILANVVDADQIPAYGVKYAAYAVKQGYTSGTDASIAPKVKFSALQGISATSFLTWILKIGMGYADVGTANAVSAAVEAKVLSLSDAITIGAKGELIRDDIAGILYGAAMTGVNKDGKTFIQSLIDAKFVSEAVAAENGFVTLAPATLAVESVTADNLKAIVVKFNKEVNKNKVSKDTVKVLDGTTLQSVTPLLLDDNKTLVVMSDSSYTQMKSYKLVIDGVELKDSSSEKVTGYENSLVVADTTQPKILSVAITSPKTIEITFSEPIQRGSLDGQFPVGAGVVSSIKNGGVNVYVASSSTLQESVKSNKIIVTLGTALAAGDRTIKISGLKDYANFPITDTEYVINVPADTTAPSIVSAEALTLRKVKVVFDEPVDANTIKLNNDSFKIAGQQITQKANPSGDNKTFELSFGSDLTLAAIVEVNIDYKGVKDHYGNEVSSTKTFTFKVEDETVAPTVTAAVVDNNVVELTFSENVTGATVSSAYELYDKDNKKVYSKTFTVTSKTIDGSPSDKVYSMDISGRLNMSGDYTIKILADKITDTSVRKNKLAATSLTLNFADKVAPTITKADFVNEAAAGDINTDSDAFDAKITIYFSEAMDPETISNKNNYMLSGSYLGSDDTVTAASDNKSVVIVLNRGTELTLTGNEDLRVFAVKDAAGNMLAGSFLNVDLNTIGGDLFKAYVGTFNWSQAIKSVEATAQGSIKITMNDGYLLKSVDPNKVKFTEVGGNNITDLMVAGVSIASDSKSVVLTLNRDLDISAKADGDDADTVSGAVQIYTDEAGAFELNNGAKLNPTGAAAATQVADKIAPVLDKITVKADSGADNDTIVLTMKEAVSADDNYKFDLVVKDLTDDKVLSVGTDYTAAAGVTNQKTIELVITKAGVKDHRFSVELLNGRFIADSAGNTTAAFDAKVVQNSDNNAEGFVTEKTAPTATGDFTNADAKIVVITFSEAMNADTLIQTNFSSADGGPITAFTKASDNKSVTITFTTDLDSGDTVLINSAVTDAQGNAISTTLVAKP